MMILNQETADKKLRRLAMEVAERNYQKKELVLIGIKENGMFIAQKIARYLKEAFAGNIVILELSLNKKMPKEIVLNPSYSFEEASILIVDDVANSGRTMLYALKPLLEYLPQQIETLVLVERTYKKFPIAVDYVGLSVSTTVQENIVVKVENGEVLGAWLA